MEDNEEKKKSIDSGKNPNSMETEKGAETKEDKKKKTHGDESDSKSGIAETCVGIANSCEDGNSLTACIKGFGTGSKELVVLVHNSGEKPLKVNLAGSSGESFAKGLEVPKQGTERINISLTVSKSSQLVLSAGNGDCVLPLNALVSEGNFFLNLPSYDKLVTPVRNRQHDIDMI
ncbi:hypothetical protein CRYUN_Cryun21dG0124400 [Craigia yunnanensis]